MEDVLRKCILEVRISKWKALESYQSDTGLSSRPPCCLSQRELTSLCVPGFCRPLPPTLKPVSFDRTITAPKKYKIWQ